MAGFSNAGMEATPVWWTYPFKPVRVDSGIFDRIDCSKYTAERKFDGHRAVLVAGPNGSSLWTRERRRIEVPDFMQGEIDRLSLPVGTVLDGEIWDPEKRGGWKNSRVTKCRLTFWDVIRVGTEDVRSRPLEERRAAMARLVGRGSDSISCVEVLPASREAHDVALDDALRNRGTSGFIHGIVLKRIGSPRRDSNVRCVEHPDWLKVVFPGMGSE